MLTFSHNAALMLKRFCDSFGASHGVIDAFHEKLPSISATSRLSPSSRIRFTEEAALTAASELLTQTLLQITHLFVM